MKHCKTCKTTVPNSYRMCPQCGTATLVATNAPMQNINTQPLPKKNNTGKQNITKTTHAPNHAPKPKQFVKAPPKSVPTNNKKPRAKRIPMLKPWAVVVLLLVCVSAVLGLFKASDGVASWMVNNTSVEEEVALTNEFIEAEGILDYAYDQNSQGSIEINQIGQGLVNHISPRSDYDYEFYLIHSNDINAFAMPGGKIFVYEGLYNKISTDELASVLAHEIIHAENRHGLHGMYKDMSMAAVLMWMFGMNDVGTNMIHSLSSLRYSRELETEADTQGVKLLIDSGHDPQGMVNMLNKLDSLDGESGDKTPEWLLTHPHGANRAQEIQKVINEY